MNNSGQDNLLIVYHTVGYAITSFFLYEYYAVNLVKVFYIAKAFNEIETFTIYSATIGLPFRASLSLMQK